MKRIRSIKKLISLFFVLAIAFCSVFAFSSCEDQSSSAPPEINKEALRKDLYASMKNQVNAGMGATFSGEFSRQISAMALEQRFTGCAFFNNESILNADLFVLTPENVIAQTDIILLRNEKIYVTGEPVSGDKDKATSSVVAGQTVIFEYTVEEYIKNLIGDEQTSNFETAQEDSADMAAILNLIEKLSQNLNAVADKYGDGIGSADLAEGETGGYVLTVGMRDVKDAILETTADIFDVLKENADKPIKDFLDIPEVDEFCTIAFDGVTGADVKAALKGTELTLPDPAGKDGISYLKEILNQFDSTLTVGKCTDDVLQEIMQEDVAAGNTVSLDALLIKMRANATIVEKLLSAETTFTFDNDKRLCSVSGNITLDTSKADMSSMGITAAIKLSLSFNADITQTSPVLLDLSKADVQKGEVF